MRWKMACKVEELRQIPLFGLLDDADYGLVARGIGADGTRVLLSQVGADAAMLSCASE